MLMTKDGVIFEVEGAVQIAAFEAAGWEPAAEKPKRRTAKKDKQAEAETAE